MNHVLINSCITRRLRASKFETVKIIDVYMDILIPAVDAKWMTTP